MVWLSLSSCTLVLSQLERMFYTSNGHQPLNSGGAAVLELAFRAGSNPAVRKGMWVRIPPAAPDPFEGFQCRATPPDVTACADVRQFGADYLYLLGLYLGDGCISKAPRDVWRLRIFRDARYSRLIDACSEAIGSVAGRRAGCQPHTGCVEIYSSWKHWPCVIPQHGMGLKHAREIALVPWQDSLVRRFPQELIRGLIHSDGCRVINRVQRPLKSGVKEYDYVRYFFTNTSSDIRQLFTETCALIGVSCRPTNERNISVARRDSVQVLEEFIGPKS